ncbi:MAG: EAL domain-containing response regulator, partial [Gammaproteobacteria bacterium]|nr:EAL domain-containing response regulator [Gammaproteobacteria bacterium]
MMTPMPERNANRLLVVDTDTRVLKRAAQAGERLGFAVACAADQAQLRDEVARFAPTVIMIDPDGIGTLEEDPFRWLGERRERASLILASEQEPIPLSPGEVAMAYGLEVTGALRKPLRDEALDEALSPLYIRRRRVTEQDLRRAVDRAQLCAHYQPRMRLGAYGWTVAGVEALLRWDHPDYGLIYPDEFIGLAEEHGLIAGLTDFVLQSGIEQLSAWNRAGMNLALSVNL